MTESQSEKGIKLRRRSMRKLIGSVKQTWALLRLSLRGRYRGSSLGFVWVLSLPLLQFCVQAFVFQKIIRIDQENYLLFLALGLFPWIFATSTIEMTIGSFLNHAFFFRSVRVSPVSFVMAQGLDNFLLSVTILALVLPGLFLFYGLSVIEISTLVVALIPAALCFLVAVQSIAVLLATYQVFYRDLRFAIALLLQLIYFVSPIVYPIALVPETVRRIMEWSPVHLLLNPFRLAYFGSTGEYFDSLVLSACTAGLFAGTTWIAWKMKRGGVLLNA